MLNKEQNALITLTDAGTPGGELMRRYWQPVALSEELSADTPLPTRILGEDLVLFRDPTGQPRLIGRYCPHRAVDLSYGRLDKGGRIFPVAARFEAAAFPNHQVFRAGLVAGQAVVHFEGLVDTSLLQMDASLLELCCV